MNDRTRRKVLACGALFSVLAAIILTVVVIWLIKARTTSLPTSALSFADVPESAIPGLYKWIEAGQESFMELLDDHRFINKEGNIFPQYRWELTPQGISITWSKATDLLTNIEAVGVYSGTKVNGRPARLEKQASDPSGGWPSPRAGLAASINSTNLVASIRLEAKGETNHLDVVNTGKGDGQILPVTLDGVECYQLMRRPNRPEAYLYVRIASELKEPPFTNAAVLVEYFDDSPADRRTGFISIQYDAPADPYTRTTQRVRLTGTEKWKQAIFFLDAPVFGNRQNAGGDFRLCMINPQLCVRSIKLAKNVP